MNLYKRVISGIVIVALFLVSIFIFRSLFSVIMYGVASVMLYEWYDMNHSSIVDLLSGQIIITLPIISLLYISTIDDTGCILLTFFMIIWTMDSMAMIGGKFFGGPKLAPKISPNKTISGLIVGAICVIFVVNILIMLPIYDTSYLNDNLDLNNAHIKISIYALIIGIVAQLSDLFISYFKRKFNIQDTGTIIPGHGGMLDRFDSIILTAPIISLYLS